MLLVAHLFQISLPFNTMNWLHVCMTVCHYLDFSIYVASVQAAFSSFKDIKTSISNDWMTLVSNVTRVS